MTGCQQKKTYLQRNTSFMDYLTRSRGLFFKCDLSQYVFHFDLKKQWQFSKDMIVLKSIKCLNFGLKQLYWVICTYASVSHWQIGFQVDWSVYQTVGKVNKQFSQWDSDVIQWQQIHMQTTMWSIYESKCHKTIKNVSKSVKALYFYFVWIDW